MNDLRYFINEEKIEGGKGDNLDPKDVDQRELAVGIAVEVEHRKGDKEAAQDIALDHLKENPKYYSKAIKAGLVDEGPALKLASEFGWEIPEELDEAKVIQSKKMIDSAKVVRETTEELFGKDGSHRGLADKLFVIFNKEMRRKATDLGVPTGQVRNWKIVLRDYDSNKVNTTIKGKDID